MHFKVQRANHLQVNKQRGKCIWRSKLLLVGEVRTKSKLFCLFILFSEKKRKNKAWCAGNLLLSSLSGASLTLAFTALLGIREIEIETKRKQSLLLFFFSSVLLSELPLLFVRRSIYVLDSSV